MHNRAKEAFRQARTPKWHDAAKEIKARERPSNKDAQAVQSTSWINPDQDKRPSTRNGRTKRLKTNQRKTLYLSSTRGDTSHGDRTSLLLLGLVIIGPIIRRPNWQKMPLAQRAISPQTIKEPYTNKEIVTHLSLINKTISSYIKIGKIMIHLRYHSRYLFYNQGSWLGWDSPQ